MIAASEPRTPLRWAAVFGLVALAHGGLLALLGPVAKPLEPVAEPAMLIDLAPDQTDDPMPSEPKTYPMQAPDTVPPSAAQPDTVPPDAVPPEPPVLDPLILDPAPSPQVAKPPVMPRRVPSVARPEPAAPVPVGRPVEPGAPAPSVTAPPGSALMAASVPLSWQTRLLAHLNRFKRYPPDAQMRHRQGVAVVHLRLLPNGSAALVRLDSSSWTDALDQEAIGLIGRAQPLPVPDGEIGPIDIAVPIGFKVR
jgi:protein TonB